MNQFYSADYLSKENHPTDSAASATLGDFARNLFMQQQPVSTVFGKHEAQMQKEFRSASSVEVDDLSAIALIPPDDLDQILDSAKRGFLGAKIESTLTDVLRRRAKEDGEIAPEKREFVKLGTLVEQLNVLLRAQNSEYEIKYTGVSANQNLINDHGSLIIGVAKTNGDFFDMALGYLENNRHTLKSMCRLFELKYTKPLDE